MTKLYRDTCEKYLITALDRCRGRVTTPEELLSSPLRKPLMAGLVIWAELVPLATQSSQDIAFTLWMSADELSHDWLDYLFRKGKKADKPYPSLTSLLCFLNAHSSQETICYLMNCIRYYLIYRLRRHNNGDRKIVTLTRINEDGEIEAIDPGELEDTRIPGVLNRIIHREAMEAFIRRLGGDLLQDIAILSAALPISRMEVVKLIYAGRHVELCRELVRCIGSALQENYADAWQPFLQAAEAFVLPPRLQNVEALARHMYRKTDSRGRARFCQRVGGYPA